MRPRALTPLLLVAALTVASAALQLRQDVAVSPQSAAPPATLAAGSDGSTSLGTSATSATTSVSLPLLGSAQALQVQPGTSDWDVHMEVLSISGFGTLDSATVTLDGVTQAQVSLGDLVQDSGVDVLLESAGGDLVVAASGSATGTFEMQFVLSPAGQPQPVVTYPYTLTVS